MADEKMIITIGREHGTMGDKVAEKIRRQFELPLYDKAHLLMQQKRIHPNLHSHYLIHLHYQRSKESLNTCQLHSMMERM